MRQRRKGAVVRLPDIEAFPDVEPTKEQALKPLEEAAEVFGAYQRLQGQAGLMGEDAYTDEHEAYRAFLIEECADVVQATCNLLAAIGVTDMRGPMDDCRRRNEDRGRC